MLVPFDEATLIHHEIANPKEIFDRHRIPSMSLKPMELDGLLRFVGESEEEDKARAKELRAARTLAEKLPKLRA